MTVAAGELVTKAKAARSAFRQVRSLSTEAKNRALYAIAGALEAEQAALFEANALDMARARESGLPGELLARLELTPER